MKVCGFWLPSFTLEDLLEGSVKSLYQQEGWSQQVKPVFKCVWLSRITLGLQICEEGERVELLMLMQKFCMVLVRDLASVITTSDLSQFSFWKLVCIQDRRREISYFTLFLLFFCVYFLD